MTLYLWYLLIPYIILLTVLFVMAFFNFYHIIRFSFSSITSVVATFVYLAGLLLIMITSIIYLVRVDWGQSIQILFSI